MMKTVFSLFLGLILSLTAVNTGQALTVVSRDFDQLVERADTVFKGTVTAKSSRWVGEGDQRHIATLVTFAVEDTYKGEPATQQTLKFLGGTVGDDTMEIPDMPQFEVGQKAVLFVVNNGKQFCPLVGVAQGRFHVVKDAVTGRERVFTDDHLPVVKTAEIGKLDETGVPLLRRYAHDSNAQALSMEDFRAEILGKAKASAVR